MKIFETRKQAFDELVDPGGWPVGRSKFYEDAAKHGLCEKDKSVRLDRLLAYLRELNGGTIPGGSPDREAETVRNLQLKNRLLELQARKEDRKWLLRSDADVILHARLCALRDHLRYHAARATKESVTAAGGTPGHVAEALERLEVAIDRACNDLATDAERDMEVEFTD
ncbi:hypothetical protein [Trichloromonas sp.]|uniref:hypothetical protein n=1 Tax=Trichloromonas sp. TaxID=3069249 RepID=UPI002A431E9D|nr:hypothetical protein [Trichloromonas sp.]